MPSAPIRFGNLLASGDSQLAGAMPRAMNVVVDGRGAVRRRPGIRTWSGAPLVIREPNPVVGLYGVGDSLLHVHQGAGSYRPVLRTYGGASGYVAASDSTAFTGTLRPTFAEDRWHVFLAGGNNLQKVNKTSWVMSRVGGSPPPCSTVACLAQRVLVDDGTDTSTVGFVRYSGLGLTGSETWDARKYFDTEAASDGVVALRSNSSELFAWGTRTLQVYSPDASSVFAPVRPLALGLASRYGVVEIDQAFGWPDNQGRIVISDGRGFEDITGGMGSVFDAVDFSDAFGYRVNLGQCDLVGWTLPTEERTFVWQRGVEGGGWAEWASWNLGSGSYAAMPITAAHYWAEQNLHLVGLGTGQIAELSYDAQDDLGTLIKAEVTTGFDNRGTDARKHCRRVRFVFERQTARGLVLVSWRDDLGAFCDPIAIDLDVGAFADYDPVIELTSLGVYRRRQWRLEMTDAQALVLAGVEEEFDVL